MTKKELIYRLLELFNSYKISDDTDITKELISSWIDTKRAYLIRVDANKNRSFDQDIIQDLGCLELEMADIAECCDISSCRYVLRTKQILPSFIELYNKTGITRVGIVDKLSLKVSFITYEQAKVAGSNRFNKEMLFAFYRNSRMYLISNNKLSLALKWINIQGVLETPEDASNYNTCTGSPCYSFDTKYPIKSWMVDIMEQSIVQEKLNIKFMPKDSSNDSSDNNVSMNIKK